MIDNTAIALELERIVTFSLMGLTVLASWAKPVCFGRNKVQAWALVGVAACLIGVTLGTVSPQTCAIFVLAGCLGHAVIASRAGHGKNVLAVLCVVTTACLGTGVFDTKGLNLLTNLQTSTDAGFFRISADPGAALAATVLIGVFCQRARSWKELGSTLARALPIACLTTGVVMALAMATGFLRFEPKLPWFTWVYVLKTLLWTCALEESFFRGLLQERLATCRFRRTPLRLPAWATVVVPAVLFGIAHIRGGWLYVALATVAGIGYGTCYKTSRRIEAAMLAHFALNTTHFLFFTYPSIRGN